jgi:hypothetical protein
MVIYRFSESQYTEVIARELLGPTHVTTTHSTPRLTTQRTREKNYEINRFYYYIRSRMFIVR